MGDMTSLCYKGFDEEKNPKENFYAVYRKLFMELDAEEDGDFRAAFGNSKTDWKEVNEFYASWEAYVTNKKYANLDQYDTREAPDRRYRRAMEAENKKIRDNAKKKRNEAVRDLVRFVRKRYPRVIARNEELTEKAEENKRKMEERKQAELEKKI